MDSLKATLAEKRKTHQAELSHASAEKKIFVRRGDVRQAQEEEEERRRAEAESRRQAQAERRQQEQEAARARFHAKKARQDAAAASQAGKSDAHASTAQPPSDDQAHQDSAELNPDSSHHEAGANFQVSDEDAIRRLRSRGEPIRLFGETSKERRLRLRALELMEQRGDKVGQNDFMDALGRAERSETVATLEKRMAAQSSRSSEAKQESHDDSEGREEYTTVKGKAKHRPGANMDSVLDLSLFQTDEAKVYPLIYYFLKGLLQEWAEALAARPDEVRSSVAGKRAAATQVQSESNLKPLFKQLRHRVRSNPQSYLMFGLRRWMTDCALSLCFLRALCVGCL